MNWNSCLDKNRLLIRNRWLFVFNYYLLSRELYRYLVRIVVYFSGLTLTGNFTNIKRLNIKRVIIILTNSWSETAKIFRKVFPTYSYYSSVISLLNNSNFNIKRVIITLINSWSKKFSEKLCSTYYYIILLYFYFPIF